MKTVFLLNIQSGAKKTQHFQNRFSHIYIYQNTPYYIYQIKQNWMNFMMVKTESKNILPQTFYTSLKTTFKNTSHKERNFQGKRRNLFCLNMEVERKESKTKLNRK